jgi:hypothetical protein
MIGETAKPQWIIAVLRFLNRSPFQNRSLSVQVTGQFRGFAVSNRS